MKTRTFVEQHWIDKAKDIGVAYFGEDKNKILRVKDECAKEIMWFIFSQVKQEDLENRVEKYKRMEEHATILKKVDPYWVQRLEFLEWILN